MQYHFILLQEKINLGTDIYILPDAAAPGVNKKRSICGTRNDPNYEEHKSVS